MMEPITDLCRAECFLFELFFAANRSFVFVTVLLQQGSGPRTDSEEEVMRDVTSKPQAMFWHTRIGETESKQDHFFDLYHAVQGFLP